MTIKAYVIETRAIVTRRYEVSAHTVKDALKDYCGTEPAGTEDEDEEVLSIKPL